MEEYFCGLVRDFPWNTFGTALGTIATAVIAWMACKISYQQYQIEKYKRQDFLFERRFIFYETLRKIAVLMLSEHSRKNSRRQMPKGIYPELTDLINMSDFLFNDKNIKNELNEMDVKIKTFYRLYRVEPQKETIEDEKILRYFYDCVHNENLILLFKPYFT